MIEYGCTKYKKRALFGALFLFSEGHYEITVREFGHAPQLG